MSKSFSSLFVLAALVAVSCCGLIISIPPGRERCVMEEVRAGNAFTLEWRVYEGEGKDELRVVERDDSSRPFTFRVTDSTGLELHRGTTVKGTFAYEPRQNGAIRLCAADSSSGWKSVPRSVGMEHVHGTTTKEYSELAKKEKLAPIAMELRRIEEEAYAIKDEISYQKQREITLRNSLDVMNTRTAWLPVTIVLVTAASAAFQVFYLRKFFEKKKLV